MNQGARDENERIHQRKVLDRLDKLVRLEQCIFYMLVLFALIVVRELLVGALK